MTDLLTPPLTSPIIQPYTSTTAQRSQTNFKALITSQSFLFDVSLHRGIGKKSLPYEVMGITAKQARERRISAPTILIFEDLEKYANKVESVIAKMRSILITFAPFKYFHANRAAEMHALVQEAHDKLAEGLGHIETNYAANKQSFLTRLEQTLEDYRARYQVELDIDQLVERFTPYFPEFSTVQTSFRLIINGPYYLPSLQDEAAYNAALAQSLVSIEQSEHIRAIQDNYAAEINNGLVQAVEATRQEVFAKLTSVLADMREIKPSESSNKVQAELKTVLERCRTLLSFDDTLNLQGLLSQVRAVSSTVEENRNDLLADTVKQEVSQLEQLLTQVKRDYQGERQSNDVMMLF